jgi:hypothetical protein
MSVAGRRLPVKLALHGLLSFLCILDDFAQTGMRAQKAISKGQGIGTGRRPLLDAFGKIYNPNLNDTAIFKAAQGPGFCLHGLFRHRGPPL